jgi:ribosomal-protein-alanine N-acetyltransferase
MKIQSVSSNDLISIARIEKELFNEDAFGIFVLLHYLQNHLFFEKIVDEKNTIIGFGIITQFDPDVLNPNEKKLIGAVQKQREQIAHLVDFAIRKEFWSMGYGTCLLQHFGEELKEKKIKILYLEVDSNNTRAIRFYKNNSFTSLGTIKSYYSNGNNALTMVKQLERFSETL